MDPLGEVLGGRVLEQVASGTVGERLSHVGRVLEGRGHDGHARPFGLDHAEQLQTVGV